MGLPRVTKRRIAIRTGRRYIDAFMRDAFAGLDGDLQWHATRRSELMSRWERNEHANVVRLDYESEIDPGSLDAGLWNRAPQYAVSYE